MFVAFLYSLIYFTKKQDNLGQELQCTSKVKEDLSKVLNFQDAKNNVFKLIKIKIVFFSIDHNDIFDHKKCIGSGNLLRHVTCGNMRYAIETEKNLCYSTFLSWFYSVEKHRRQVQ